MKKITLRGILNALQNMEHEVLVDPAIAEKAKKAVQAMIDLPMKKGQSTYNHTGKPEVIALEARA